MTPGGDDPPAATPFRQFLVKIVSRCNLACSYCYVYEHADQSWRRRPRLLPDDVLHLTVDRIAEHVRCHAPDDVRVILHGGEPLLAGVDRLDRAARLFREADLGHSRLSLHVQTNGTLLDESFLEVFHRHRVQVGLSLDGTPAGNDRRRRHRDGSPSSADVHRALDLLREPRHRPLFGGLLGVVDIEADPIAYYEAMLAHAPPAVDLLLPHGTWDSPPPGLVDRGSAAPYADWLIPIFDRWYAAGMRTPRIRMFESVVELLLGLGTGSEHLGLAPIDIVTIETDGSIEQVDTLKVVADGAAATGLHVATHSLDAALHHPGIVARQQGLAALAPACRACPVVTVCGGGLYPHRHRASNGFANPSVYCEDLYRLIGHVRERLQADVNAVRQGRRDLGALASERRTPG